MDNAGKQGRYRRVAPLLLTQLFTNLSYSNVIWGYKGHNIHNSQTVNCQHVEGPRLGKVVAESRNKMGRGEGEEEKESIERRNGQIQVNKCYLWPFIKMAKRKSVSDLNANLGKQSERTLPNSSPVFRNLRGI